MFGLDLLDFLFIAALVLSCGGLMYAIVSSKRNSEILKQIKARETAIFDKFGLPLTSEMAAAMPPVKPPKPEGLYLRRAEVQNLVYRMRDKSRKLHGDNRDLMDMMTEIAGEIDDMDDYKI